MQNEEPIINRVAESQSLRLIDLEEYYPKNDLVGFDLQPYLFQGLMLKEKEFRESLKNVEWESYNNKAVYIHCTIDTIIPVWAYMLVATYLKDKASDIVLGNEEKLIEHIMVDKLKSIDIEYFRAKKVLVKGCSDKPVPESIYVEVARILLPVVSSLMYGEACSNVPLFRSGKMS